MLFGGIRVDGRTVDRTVKTSIFGVSIVTMLEENDDKMKNTIDFQNGSGLSTLSRSQICHAD